MESLVVLNWAAFSVSEFLELREARLGKTINRPILLYFSSPEYIKIKQLSTVWTLAEQASLCCSVVVHSSYHGHFVVVTFKATVTQFSY